MQRPAIPRSLSALCLGAALLVAKDALASQVASNGLEVTRQAGSPAPTLTLGRRIEAQRAVLAVYHSHQLGSNRALDDTLSPAALEESVRDYLRQSVALETVWKTRVTAAMLEAELARIERDTRMPERLEEIYRALGNDRFLVLECFIRPILVHRLVRNFFAFDGRVHEEPRREAEAMRRQLVSGELDATIQHPLRSVVDRPTLALMSAAPTTLMAEQVADRVSPIREERGAYVIEVQLEPDAGIPRIARYSVPKRNWEAWWPAAAPTYDARQAATVVSGTSPIHIIPSCPADDTWDNGSLGVPARAQAGAQAVWTGTYMLSWGPGIWYDPSSGTLRSGLTGVRYDPLTDTWSEMSGANAPTQRLRFTAVWTGSEMIVWGGEDGSGHELNTGGRYDPAKDRWSSTSIVNAPAARDGHTAVWTGSEMIVWAGSGDDSSPRSLNTGGRYDPATNTWSPTSALWAPVARFGHTAIWTGHEMIVWGGEPLTYGGTDTGGRYDPATDIWSPTSQVAAPEGRTQHSAVWTGSRMIVWGGLNSYSSPVATGGLYDPATDSWSPITEAGAPRPRYDHQAIWTGGQMIVWSNEEDGGRYDPASDSWSPTSQLNAPFPREQSVTVWTGSQMLVWGGCAFFCSYYYADGGRYDPVSDWWTPISTTNNGPSPRAAHSTVWTGTQMIVWGGITGLGPETATGSRYDPMTDDWSQTSLLGAPEGRGDHSAVWTGDEMLIWGGVPGFPYSESPLERGDRYEPLSDTWKPMSTVNGPVSRFRHTAVWTGHEMIVWGGFAGPGDRQSGALVNTGGRYDPNSDTWLPISAAGAPSPRFPAPAAWTGHEMLVWGGDDGAGTGLGDGARYEPTADRWRPISMRSAPTARRFHASVWVGDRLMVWGGRHTTAATVLNTGGLYDPSADLWSPITLAGAPSSRSSPHAIWTGKEAVIWGGSGTRTGGRYDPSADSWSPTSTDGAPMAADTSVWSGTHMILWGDIRGGGRYVAAASPDEDQDGVSICEGDCDDHNSLSYPGAPEVCDGEDNDCDGVIPTVEADADADGFSICQGDCNDRDAAINPRAVELPGNLVDENCDAWLACDEAASYKTHGQFVRCVVQECRRLVASGSVGRDQCDALIGHAAQSETGRRQRQPPHPLEP